MTDGKLANPFSCGCIDGIGDGWEDWHQRTINTSNI